MSNSWVDLFFIRKVFLHASDESLPISHLKHDWKVTERCHSVIFPDLLIYIQLTKWHPVMPTVFINKFTYVAKHSYFLFDFRSSWQNDENDVYLL